jgi:multisubunit Na+/H+ antiporter MnhB subunit
VVALMCARRLGFVKAAAPDWMEASTTHMSFNIRRPLLILMWTGIGLGVVAGALYLGNELRKQRLAKRMPYESYSHAGEDRMFNGTEYGVGI